MAGKLEAFATKHGIKYFLFNFTDLRGVQRSKLVPASAAPAMEKSGAGFAGFAAYLDMTPAYPDMFAVPDPDSLIQLPWNEAGPKVLASMVDSGWGPDGLAVDQTALWAGGWAWALIGLGMR